MANWKGKSKRRRRINDFKPSRKFIKGAVDDYLKKGGKITKLELDREYEDSIRRSRTFSEADEYLLNV